MKKILLFIFLFILSVGFAQDFKEDWREVIQLELDGKVESASKIVDNIYKKAKRKNSEDQIIKCFFYQSKFLQVREENYQTLIIQRLNREIATSKGAQEALLNYIYIEILEDYYQKNRYVINQRTDLEKNNSTDFKTWTQVDFQKEIKKTYAVLLQDENELHRTTISTFSSIVEISPYVDSKNLSIYMFLQEKVLNYYFGKYDRSNELNNAKLDLQLLTIPSEFVKIKTDTISNESLKSLLQIFINTEKYALQKANQDLDVLHYDRMKKFFKNADDKEMYIAALQKLESTTKNKYLLQDLKVDFAKNYFEMTSKISENNYFPKVLTLIDTILSKRENPNAKAEAESIKESILKKSLTLNIPSTLYAFQNYRAFVEFKNVDTLKVNYYRIPVKIFKELIKDNWRYRNNGNKILNKDSIVIQYIKDNFPLKSVLKTLPPKTDHFSYSTEILMDTLDIGHYIAFFETKNPYYDTKKAFAYKPIQVSNIDFVQQEDADADFFNLLHRKTGKPIENAFIKNDSTTIKSNKFGKAGFELASKYSNAYSELLFIKDADTLYTSYYKSYKRNKDEDSFKAKAMVFFDRAIYRPGQKVFFKGYMFQLKNNVKSVVPNLTVHVTIEDANEDEVKSFNIQTNEFGSFTGEYDIPKNLLNGSFSIKLEEPDDYEMDTKYYNKEEEEHSFWDNVDYDDYQSFSFKVEEYKRPTFEITFDKIKENYSIGDTITLKGNAKSLAGSDVTNAKVNYTLSKYVQLNQGYFDNNKKDTVSETITDESGNFKITFVANQDSIPYKTIKLLNYSVDVAVTDLNGETRTQIFRAKVTNQMLELGILSLSSYVKEEKNTFEIVATTANNFPIPTKGTITFIKKIKKEFLVKKEMFPEINSISREEHKKLFPYEPYAEKDTKSNEKTVLTLPFDTEKSTLVDLSFFKNFEVGDYNIILKAKDIKGNDVESERNFRLTSKIMKPSNASLFIVNKINSDKNNFIFEIKSVIPDLYITSRMFEGSKQNGDQIVQLKNGSAIVKILRKANYEDNIKFHFSTVWEGIYFEDEITILKETIKTQLDFEIVSMRNKVEPGSLENWSFVLKNSKQQSEVLASMYDVSLDQFATSNWQINDFYTYSQTPSISHRMESWYENTIAFNNLYFKTIYEKLNNAAPELNWFGFNFNNQNKYLKQKYLIMASQNVIIPKNAKTISGVVSDENGPLPGAIIVVEGTNRGTQTDFDGRYTIEVASGETLVYSYIGFEVKTTLVESQKNINIKLNESENALQEVVVSAMGISKDLKSLSSSTIIVEDNSIYEPNVSLEQILNGRVAGVQIGRGSGQPGQATTVRIRGAASLTEQNESLIILDGKPISAEEFAKLNEADILSVNVLTNASAIALYGTRGSNGVIVISTKSEMKALEQVKTRTNFNETAFFYPNLTTDAKGNLNFSFTTPESLTKWRLRLFGHNKKAETGYFQTDIVSQKDLMVMPNMPRFVREKDVIQFSTKIVNLTNETKSGSAILMLFDAATNTALDSITMNSNNIKPFNCKPKESIAVNWTVTIPEGLQGLRYKVIAKSGTVSDGEENILPVLTDKILITESIPIWVKGNTKREFTLENLKNNTSTTLKNHSLTFEYTSNPIWIALQALPYLMTYEHECSEQVFAKYYANCIAEKIITSNPKIENLFKKWHDDQSVSSKLQMNEELKSIVLSETPWLLDTESDAEKNKRLAILLDLNTLKEKNSETFKKLEDKILPTGGFPWFSGGTEDRFISQHILTGIGHLLNSFPEDSLKYKNIVSKGIPNLDRKFATNHSPKAKIVRPSTLDLNYLYTRSFYLKNHPISAKTDSIIQLQLKQCKTDWVSYSLYEKGLLALIMNRFNEKDFAKKVITSLKETTSTNDEIGMYWIENNSGSGWYQSQIATQSLLIEAFAEIDKDKETIDAMKFWLIKNKQTNRWSSTKSTTEAVYALMTQGSDWVSMKENIKIKMGDEKMFTQKISNKEDELNAGYLKIQYNAEEINPKMATVSVNNKSQVPGFGGLYWQYFESLENIKKDSTKTISIDKKIFKKVATSKGEELIAISDNTLKVGDLVTVRLIVKTDTDLEFVHLKDLRASCLEPVHVISGYEWKGSFSYYKSTKDISTNFFFDRLQKGTYVLEYDLRVDNQGTFNSGISTLQSMYAPEFSAHSENSKILVKE